MIYKGEQEKNHIWTTNEITYTAISNPEMKSKLKLQLHTQFYFMFRMNLNNNMKRRRVTYDKQMELLIATIDMKWNPICNHSFIHNCPFYSHANETTRMEQQNRKQSLSKWNCFCSSIQFADPYSKIFLKFIAFFTSHRVHKNSWLSISLNTKSQ